MADDVMMDLARWKDALNGCSSLTPYAAEALYRIWSVHGDDLGRVRVKQSLLIKTAQCSNWSLIRWLRAASKAGLLVRLEKRRWKRSHLSKTRTQMEPETWAIPAHFTRGGS